MTQGTFGFLPSTPTVDTLKALTVRQPWAWSIVAGIKTIENRSRPTRHRGDLVIHAGLSREDLRALPAEIRAMMPGLPEEADLAFGAFIGVVRVVDCVPIAEVADQPFATGPWCWILSDPRPIEPIPWRGELGMFNVPAPPISAALLGFRSLCPEGAPTIPGF